MKNLVLLLCLLPLLEAVNAQTSKGSFVVGFHNFSPVPLPSDGLASNNLFPQTNAFGISFGTSKQKIDGELQDGKQNNSVFGLSLNSQYFVADQFAIGLTGSFSSGSTVYKEDGSDDDKSSSTIILIGPEMRYYFDAGAKTKFWLKGGAGFGSLSSKYNGDGGDPINLSQFGGGAGISLFPVSTVSIDFGLGYNVLTATDKDDSFGDTKYINSGLAFDIGVGIFF
jgi:hypothetical protein